MKSSSTMTRIAAGTALVAALSVAGGGLAAAQDDGTATTAPAGQERPTEGRRHPVLRGVVKTAGTAAAAAIGISTEELRTAVRAGSSIAQVAESKGVDVAAVTDAMAKALTAKIDERVASGDLDAARAEKAKARIPTLVEKLVNRVPKAATSG